MKTEACSSDTCSSMSASTTRNLLREKIMLSSSSWEYWSRRDKDQDSVTDGPTAAGGPQGFLLARCCSRSRIQGS